LTNSSSIFVGVEVPLYPFLNALKKEGPTAPRTVEAHSKCAELLKDDTDLTSMLRFTEEVLTSPELRSVCHFEKWPEHNNQAQMDKLITAATQLVEMHKDTKKLITFVLSEDIFRATGYLMFHDSYQLQKPVYWLGHDVLAKALVSGKTL
jgi:Cu2+-containing amine oxidase